MQADIQTKSGMLCLNAYKWQWYNKSLPSAGATDMEIQILLVTV